MKEKIVKEIGLFRDFMWVLQAFLRGTMLCQKAYQPQSKVFRLPESVPAHRITMLMRWRGYKPLTAKDVKEIGSAPFLDWDRKKEVFRVRFGGLLNNVDEKDRVFIRRS